MIIYYYNLRLVSFIAPRLNKPVSRFNWVLETDKLMSKEIEIRIPGLAFFTNFVLIL